MSTERDIKARLEIEAAGDKTAFKDAAEDVGQLGTTSASAAEDLNAAAAALERLKTAGADLSSFLAPAREEISKTREELAGLRAEIEALRDLEAA